jgi:microcystin-dependent protein
MTIVISGSTGISANAAQFLIGQVVFMAGANAPSGFLKCNGQLVSRTTYASLFAVIGTTYGAGDGSTTFAVPDLRGEFIRGLDDGRNVDAGRAMGSAQADELKSHNHSINLNAYLVGSVSGSAVGLGSQNGVVIGNTGGTETRPRNVALLACIFTGV